MRLIWTLLFVLTVFPNIGEALDQVCDNGYSIQNHAITDGFEWANKGNRNMTLEDCRELCIASNNYGLPCILFRYNSTIGKCRIMPSNSECYSDTYCAKEGFVCREGCCVDAKTENPDPILTTECTFMTADVILVIDGSGSITAPIFHSHTKSFVRELISRFNIGRTRIGIVAYSTDVYFTVPLNECSDNACLINKINNLTYDQACSLIFDLCSLSSQGTTCTGDAIATATTMFDRISAEPERAKLVIVITDGEEWCYQRNGTILRSTVPWRSAAARSAGIDLIAVAVGTNVTWSSPEAVADFNAISNNDPSKRFKAQDYAAPTAGWQLNDTAYWKWRGVVQYGKCDLAPRCGFRPYAPKGYDFSADPGIITGYFPNRNKWFEYEMYDCAQTCVHSENYDLLPCIGFHWRRSDGRCLIFHCNLPQIVDGPKAESLQPEYLYDMCRNSSTTTPTVTTTPTPLIPLPGEFRGCTNLEGPINISHSVTSVIIAGFFKDYEGCRDVCLNLHLIGKRCYGFIVEPYWSVFMGPYVEPYGDLGDYVINVISSLPSYKLRCIIFPTPVENVTRHSSSSSQLYKCSTPVMTTTLKPPTVAASKTTTASTTSTKQSTTTATQRATSTTTSTPSAPSAFSSTTTAISQSTTTNANGQVCENGFILLNEHLDMNAVGAGKFGGYFLFEDSCRELCKNNYGLGTCIGYAYEPDNRGKCTIFQYDVSSHRSDSDSTVRLVAKC